MPGRKLVGASWVALTTLAVCGCANKNDPPAAPAPTPPPSMSAPAPVRNEWNADEKLREAAAAEQKGEYARAMEIYEQLRSFPPDARPNDLDRRIEAVRQKMQTQGR